MRYKDIRKLWLTTHGSSSSSAAVERIDSCSALPGAPTGARCHELPRDDDAARELGVPLARLGVRARKVEWRAAMAASAVKSAPQTKPTSDSLAAQLPPSCCGAARSRGTLTSERSSSAPRLRSVGFAGLPTAMKPTEARGEASPECHARSECSLSRTMYFCPEEPTTSAAGAQGGEARGARGRGRCA